MDNLEFVPNSQVEGFDISQNTLLPGDNSLNNDISLDTSTDGSFQDPLASNEITPIALEQDFTGEISESEIAPIQLNNLDTDGTVDPLIGSSQPQAALSTTFETNETGVFTVNATGEFTIDFLFDAGSYRSEFAVFSLKGMEELTPGSSEYIKEATRRALTNSEEGYVIIADDSEGARFTGELGESDKNAGNYSGIKTYSMNPGDDFAFMLVPQGKLQEVFDNPAIDGDQRPLFSIASANPGNATQMMQLLDGTADGGVFGIEDLRLDQNSDADYNDIIFHVKGAAGKATPLVDVVNPGNPWYETAKGGELLDFAATNNIFDEASEITIGLVNDTGSSQTDGITNDPLLSGSISNVGQVASFKAGFNGSQDLIDISDSLKSDGSFSLDNEKLEQINNDSLADGDRILTLQAEDASGNVLNTTNFSFTLDTQVAAPTNLIVSGVDGSVTNDNTPTITGEAEAGSKVELFNGGQFVGETTVNSPWEITTVALADGVQSITAKATDVAGNVSTASQTLEFTVDTVAPQLNITSPVADAVLSNGARLTGKLDEAGAGIVNLTYQFGGADAVTVPVNENGEFDVELDLTGLSNGTQTLTIATTDLAGNTTSNEISVNVNLDVTAPVITASLATDSGSSDSDKITNNPAITGSVTDNSEITSFSAGFDDTATENFVDVLAELQGGSFSFDAAKLKQINGDADLSEGEHTLKIIATDAVGNVSEVLEFTFTLDTQLPSLTVNNPSADQELTSGAKFTGTIDGTGSEIASLTYQFNAGSEITVPVN
ncbi:MAG: Ig-like domain-containing protein, partial [Cyanobacteria bacterium J06573_2]